MRARVKPTKTWVSKSNVEIENGEELLACRRIILKIVRYMKDNKMSQKDLAQKLNVSPQYINKLLHGQDLDLKITTVMKYGRILGLKLIVIPEEETTTVKEVICITTTALYNEAGTNQFKYNRSNAIVGLRCNS